MWKTDFLSELSGKMLWENPVDNKKYLPDLSTLSTQWKNETRLSTIYPQKLRPLGFHPQYPHKGVTPLTQFAKTAFLRGFAPQANKSFAQAFSKACGVWGRAP